MALSPISFERLSTCHVKLQTLVLAVCEIVPLTVVCGHRGELEQHEAFINKTSQVDWPNSKHNALPSLAVDIVPLEYTESGKATIDWKDVPRFCFVAGMMIDRAKILGINLRFGGDWDQDTELKDNKFNDLPHFELVET